ncbi:hypothetical protein L6452_42824 [Arctium lappa]|uniref:Uncharacterized protein n=1 Tax=Arctium lappa TaxID=4217 RepID=A0ACB8XL31_ARCLA|nr:hypothetical protein L6452_42824 [Arctium lappa]
MNDAERISRKRRDQRKSPVSKPVAILDLNEEEGSREEILEEKKESKIDANVNAKKEQKSNESSSLIPCIDRLREELSCARCPKCKQLISNGRSCTINTVLWNTIQLLFPQEIEARKVVAGGSNTKESNDLQSPPVTRRNQYRSVIEALNSPEGEQLSLERWRRTGNHNLRQQSFRPASVVLLNSREAGDNSVTRRREVVMPLAAPPPPDVSMNAIQTGATTGACSAINRVIYNLPLCITGLPYGFRFIAKSSYDLSKSDALFCLCEVSSAARTQGMPVQVFLEFELKRTPHTHSLPPTYCRCHPHPLSLPLPTAAAATSDCFHLHPPLLHAYKYRSVLQNLKFDKLHTTVL